MSEITKKSGRVCQICGWKEYYSSSKVESKHRFFARFPLDEDRCREWVRVTGNEDLVHLPIEKLHQLKFVCGDHFERKYFNKKENRLNNQAIPTLKLISVPLNDIQMAEFPQHMFSSQGLQEINQPKVIKLKKSGTENIKPQEACASPTDAPAEVRLPKPDITLQPSDDRGIKPSAVQSDRAIVLSDAGKFILKESASPITSAAVGEAGATVVTDVEGGVRTEGVVVRTTPVCSPLRAVRVFGLQNKLPGSLQAEQAMSGPKVTMFKVKAHEPGVKIIINEASHLLNKHLASQPNNASQQVIHQASQQLLVSDLEVETVSETMESVRVLHAQLQAAQAKIRKLQAAPAKIRELQAELNKTRAELNKTRARLAQYEPPDH